MEETIIHPGIKIYSSLKNDNIFKKNLIFSVTFWSERG